jgi:hypothetical protein
MRKPRVPRQINPSFLSLTTPSWEHENLLETIVETTNSREVPVKVKLVSAFVKRPIILKIMDIGPTLPERYMALGLSIATA